MSKKFIINGCPCCGNEAHWTRGNEQTKMEDKTQCLNCFLEVVGTYKPMSSVELWNNRTAMHLIKKSTWNIEGAKC